MEKILGSALTTFYEIRLRELLLVFEMISDFDMRFWGLEELIILLRLSSFSEGGVIVSFKMLSSWLVC